MRRLLNRHEVRFLGSGIGVVALASAVLAGWWWGPWSPAALERPADHLVQGDVAGAVQEYRELSDSWAFRSTRAEALWRAAQLAQSELSDPSLALQLLDEFATRFPEHAQVGTARELQATLLLSRLDDPTAAAYAFMLAAVAAPSDLRAGRWLLRAGRLRADIGDIDGARRVLGLATQHPEVAPTAWLALGRIAMGEDASAAVDAFSEALNAGADGAEAELARAGREAAMGQLGTGLADAEQLGGDSSELP